MPIEGEGETIASQTVTAVNRLYEGWYKDGDVFDNTGGAFPPNSAQISECANWLFAYVPEVRETLEMVYECARDFEYDYIINKLVRIITEQGFLKEKAEREAVDSIYTCEGPFYTETGEDEELYIEEPDWDDEEFDR